MDTMKKELEKLSLKELRNLYQEMKGEAALPGMNRRQLATELVRSWNGSAEPRLEPQSGQPVSASRVESVPVDGTEIVHTFRDGEKVVAQVVPGGYNHEGVLHPSLRALTIAVMMGRTEHPERIGATNFWGLGKKGEGAHKATKPRPDAGQRLIDACLDEAKDADDETRGQIAARLREVALRLVAAAAELENGLEG